MSASACRVRLFNRWLGRRKYGGRLLAFLGSIPRLATRVEGLPPSPGSRRSRRVCALARQPPVFANVVNTPETGG